MIKTYTSKKFDPKVEAGSITVDLTAVVVAYGHGDGTMVNVGSHVYYLDIDHDDFVDDWKEANGYGVTAYPFENYVSAANE